MDNGFGTCLYARSVVAFECSIDHLGIPINSIQQFLTTFVAGRVIICSGSSDPIIKAFASVETQTGLVYSPETRN